MVLSELRAIAAAGHNGWLVRWTEQGYTVEKLPPDGLENNVEMRLEAERAGKKRVRYFKSLDAVARVMSDDLRVVHYAVAGRVT
jgi:hypothetical protein